MWSGTGNLILFFLYGIGKTISDVLVYELIIAQSPDKMKGFVFGISIAFRGFFLLFVLNFHS